MELAQLFDILGILILGVGVGLGCGSYATMPYYRLPTGESCAGKWIGAKSHCVVCDIQLRTRDLVPVFNWLGTRGKCYGCGTKINPVYFFIELSVTVFSVLSYLKFGPELLNYHLIVLGLGTCVVILGATEYTYRKIPDAILVVMVMLAFLYHSPEDLYDMVYSLILCVLLSVGYAKRKEEKTGKEYEGYGRLKMFCVAGLWFLPLQMVLFAVILLVLCPLVAMLQAKDDERTPPYAMAIALAFMITILVDYPALKALVLPTAP